MRSTDRSPAVRPRWRFTRLPRFRRPAVSPGLSTRSTRWDPVYAKNIGVDIDNLYISQPDNGEQAMEITETMVRSGAIDIVIVDSVAALVPKAEIDGDMGDSPCGSPGPPDVPRRCGN